MVGTTLYNLGLALLKERRAPEAERTFARLEESEPDHARAGRVRGRVGAVRTPPLPRRRHAASARAAAKAMVESGDYVAGDGGGSAAPGFAPKRRIYELAAEKGAG